MHPLESFAGLMTWASKNTAYNLQFIPDDKLAWKPSPTANSALEIVQHVCTAVRSMRTVLDGGEFSIVKAELPEGRGQAQAMLENDGADYAAALRAVDPRSLGNTVTVWGHITLPLARAASMPVVDMVHHHGQIAYLQAVLGDKDYHFYEEVG